MSAPNPATSSVEAQGTSILRKRHSLRVAIRDSIARPVIAGAALDDMKAHYDSSYALVGGRVVEVTPSDRSSPYAPGSVAKRVWRELGFRDLRHLYENDPDGDVLPNKVSYGFKLVGVDIFLCILWDVNSVVRRIPTFSPEGLFHLPHRVALTAICRTSLDHDTSARLADMMAVCHRGFTIDACRIEPVKGELHALVTTANRFSNVALEFMSLSAMKFPLWINLGLNSEIASDPDIISRLEDYIVNNSLLGFIEGEPTERITVTGLFDTVLESDNPLYRPSVGSAEGALS